MESDILAAWDHQQARLDRNAISIEPLSAAWLTATASLDARRLASATLPDLSSSDMSRATQLLARAGMMDELLDEYLRSLRNAFDLVEQEIALRLNEVEASTGAAQHDAMLVLFHSIGTLIRRWQAPISLFWPSSSALSRFRKTFLASLHYVLPPRFVDHLRTFLRHLLSMPRPAFDAPSNRNLAFPTLVTVLDRYDPLLFALIYEEIEKRTKAECERAFRDKKLEGLVRWLNGGDGTGVLGWLSGIYEGNLDGGPDEAKKFLKPTFSRFEYHIHKTLCQLRTTEMFDIILDYPESKPALEDLKVCLVKTDQRSTLVSRLREQIAERLLHPGSDTKDIITTYISTIRCLRIIDPPGVLLSRVADPIRRYLRSRKDTIRCIVSSLIEEGNPLFDELTTSDAKLVSDSRDEAENYTDQKWMPDPADAPPDFRKSRGADVIQLLVSIYDTKEVFVKELQVLLAQRLLVIRDYQFDKEIKNVATLKGRFGEQSLQGCDVMLKDLEDSRRIDRSVHEANPSLPLHATVVSRLFWPSFQHAPLRLPGQLGRVQSAYDRAFARAKGDKRLRWLPQLGNVNLTIELRDRTFTLDATPVQAAVIELFDKQDTWTPDALQAELRLSELANVRNALFFWNNLGVVQSLENDAWKLVEEVGRAQGNEPDQVAHVFEEEKQAVQSVEAQRVEQMRVYWNYIQGMLTNLGALPITRIHTTLNMLVPDYKGKTTDELKALLESVEADGLVQKTASGSWKIVK